MNLDDLLVFSTEDADRVFEELKDLGVELDADPLVYGPKRLNQKVSEVRKALGRTERIFLELAQRHHTIQRTKTIAAAEIEMAQKSLFANDPETRAGRSVSDREAIAYGKLREEILALQSLELALQSLEAVQTVVKATRSDLRDTQSRLRDQVRLCQEEIGLGSSWGSKVPNASPLNPHAAMPTSNLSAIGQLLERVDGEIHLGFGEEDEDAEGTGFTEDAPVITDIGVIVEPDVDLDTEVLVGEPCVVVPNPDEVNGFLSKDEEEEEDGAPGFVLAEDFSDQPTESDAKEDLPGSAPESEVSAFLEDLPEDLMGKPDGAAVTPQIDPDDDLSAILRTFEDVE